MNKSTSIKKLREFSLIIGFGFPIIIGWLIPVIYSHHFIVWTLWVGITALFLGLIAPKVLYLPYRLWMQIGDLLGWFNSHIILGIVFFLVLLPISFLMKLIGYDPLRIKRKVTKTYKEYRKNKNIDLKKIF